MKIRDGDISWTMTFRGHFFPKWGTFRGHLLRVTSRGHFLVTFRGHFFGNSCGHLSSNKLTQTQPNPNLT